MMEVELEAYYGLGEEEKVLMIMENRFLTPYLCRGLEDGGDMVVDSGRKYMGGDKEVVGGVVRVKDERVGRGLEELEKMIGGRV